VFYGFKGYNLYKNTMNNNKILIFQLNSYSCLFRTQEINNVGIVFYN